MQEKNAPDGDLIAKIRAASDELVDLGVTRENINFYRAERDGELFEIAESIEEQLETRKLFLAGKKKIGNFK